MMVNKNPLEISRITQTKSDSVNKRGRPTMEKHINFSPQPKSIIISQIVNEMKTASEIDNINHKHVKETPLHRCQRINKLKSPAKPEEKEKQYSCDYPGCSYTCKLSCNLIKHKRTHSTEKPFLCDQCTFRTKFINSLKVHKRTHTAVRPFVCVHCTYRCNSSSNLKKHCLHRHLELSKT